jgi:LysM repeat protein
VKPGDTLSAIACRYQTTVAGLQRADNLGTSTLIRVGQKLVIPSVEGSPVIPAGAARGTC